MSQFAFVEGWQVAQVEQGQVVGQVGALATELAYAFYVVLVGDLVEVGFQVAEGVAQPFLTVLFYPKRNLPLSKFINNFILTILGRYLALLPHLFAKLPQSINFPNQLLP